MMSSNREQMYYEQDPMKMTDEEAKISVAYWRAKYEGIRENFINLQTDLDRVIDLMSDENFRRESLEGKKI